ncbi:MAG: hypothetical protein H0U59_06870, partial [Gemmatimonadaceae bacterium]|nr:hypothetical protein [Gemmatimonadaceae bacterium]
MGATSASGHRSLRSRHLISSAVKWTVERLEERRLLFGGSFDAADVTRLEQGLDQVAITFDQYGDNIRTLAGNPLAIPLLVDRHNPKIPAIAPNLADLLTMKVDQNENGLIGFFLDPPDELALNAIDTNADGKVDLGEIIANKIVAPIKSFLNSGHTPAQLAGFISGLDVPVLFGDFVMSVSSVNTSSAPAAPGAIGQVTHGQDSVSLQIALVRADQFELEIGRKADTLGLKIDPNSTAPDADKIIDLTTVFNLNLNFGYEVASTANPNLGTADPNDFIVTTTTGPFFITDQSINATVAMHENNMVLKMRVGFLDVETVNAKIDLDGVVALDIQNPASGGINGVANHITLSELQNTPIASLFSIAPTGTLNADFPLKVEQLPGAVQFYSESEDLVTFKPEFNFDAANIWNIGIQPDGSPDVRSAPPVSSNATFKELLNFTNITPQGILGIINQFAGVLNKLRDSEMFKGKIPLAKDANLATVIDLVDGLNDALLVEDNDDPSIAPVYKLIDKDGNPRFLTAQGLA